MFLLAPVVDATGAFPYVALENIHTTLGSYPGIK
jgi:hypothetical protein